MSTILNAEEINFKIERIAFQIYEANINNTSVIIAGISQNGYIIAERIVQKLNVISDLKLLLCKVQVDKSHDKKKVESVSLKDTDFENQSLVLVDDVLDSGKTLMYTINYFLRMSLKQFKTAVLVDRSHKLYPVKADYKGLSLSTSMNERVNVILDSKEENVYLS